MNQGLFERIAPIYGLFYDRQRRHFDAVLDRVHDELNLSPYKTVIDIGCGTGALCSVLSKRGFMVAGMDAAQAMLRVARKKQENGGIDFIQADAIGRVPFEDKSFDVAIACHVLHGLLGHERKKVYAEMARIAGHLVIVQDYNENRAILTDVVEWLEGGDYFDFIRKVKGELEEVFDRVRTIDVDLRATWYVCVPRAEIPGDATTKRGHF